MHLLNSSDLDPFLDAGFYSIYLLLQSYVKRLPAPYGDCRMVDELEEYYFDGSFMMEVSQFCFKLTCTYFV